MHRLFKLLLPLCLLGSAACIDVPEVEQPQPPTGSTPDAGSTSDSGTPQPAGSFTLAVDPTQASVLPGSSQSLQLFLSRTGGFADSVTVSLANPPAGISAAPVTLSSGNSSGTLVVAVDANVDPGAKTLTVRATGGTLSQETSVSLTVAQPGDLVVQWASPSQSQVYVKDSVQLQVVVQGGTADAVDLYKGSDFLTRLSAPSFQYTWDTTQEPEGTYQLTARATRAGSTFTSSVRTITVDRTAPKAKTQAPTPGARMVSVHDTIQVAFDEALKATSVTDTSVLLSTPSAANVPKTLSLSADGKTLTISPTSPLSLPADVTITLGASGAPLTDLAGNAYIPASQWTFTVPAWLPLGGALSAVSGNTPAENVAMKVGTDGNPVVAWAESDGTAKNIYVRRWTGTGWVDLGSPLSAVPGAGTDADAPALTIDFENRPVVVWQEIVGGSNKTSNLYGRRWTGSIWESLPDFVNFDSNSQSRTNATIAIDRAGNILVANEWQSGMGGAIEGFQLAPASSAWGSMLDRSSYSLRLAPTLAADSQGNWLLAFTNMNLEMSVQRNVSNTGWVQLGGAVSSPDKNGCVSAAIVFDGSNQPYIVWRESGSSTSNVYVAFWNGSSWQLIGSALNDTATLNSVDPSMIMGGDGRPMVAWSGYTAPETSIRVRRWTGSTWQDVGAPLNAVTGGSTSGLRPKLALDKNGQPLVAWHESDGTASNIYVYRYNY